jgi:hypothetical protein
MTSFEIKSNTTGPTSWSGGPTSFEKKCNTTGPGFHSSGLDELELDELDQQQRLFLDAVLRGESVFLSGQAGSGKTYVLKKSIEFLPPDSTFVTAMTGIAASLLPRGRTFQWFIGLNDFDGDPETLVYVLTE